MTIKTYLFVFASLFAVSFAAAQEAAPSEADRMRTATLAQLPREVPAAVTKNQTTAWQATSPKSLRKSARPPQNADYKFAPHVSVAESGTRYRFSPATEQLALGLTGDPPRPVYPQLDAGPRSVGASFASQEHLLLPPLSRSSEGKVNLANDAATVSLKPYTAAEVRASRSSAPARSETIPDPFVASQEVRIRAIAPDNDPPPLHFDLPERPLLPVTEVKK